MRIALRVLSALVAIALAAQPSAGIIAYYAPPGAVGLQSWGGSLGMDFDVVDEIEVDQLGIFDSAGDGLSGTLSVRLYDRTATGTPVASLSFSAGDPGTLDGAHRLKALPSAVTLPAGFQGSIVADGFTAADPNGNTASGNDPSSTDDGGGVIVFIGAGRYSGSAGVYPTGIDGGPPGRYLAGTFNYAPTGAPPPPPPSVPPGPVPLKMATAIHSQGGFPVASLIDGNTASGWANSAGGDNTAVAESDGDIASATGARLTFTIDSGGYGTHTLGRFRLSVTGDDRDEFADGLNSGGDVTANWTVLEPLSAVSDNASTTLTTLGDLSLLAGGGVAEYETYTVVAETDLPVITGFRLEALEHSSFPGNGPGRAANGNFVVYEFGVSWVPLAGEMIPEPASAVLLLVGLPAILGRRRRA